MSNITNNVMRNPLLEAAVETGRTLHYERRDQLNGEHPSYDEVMQEGSGWTLVSEGQTKLHDDNRGERELKFIHESGREAVFTRDCSADDTYEPVENPRYAATYNFANPAPKPTRLSEVPNYISSGTAHVVKDVAPWVLGGSVRGRDSASGPGVCLDEPSEP